tara:strand:+ start:50439 stop:50765 length:327 start_codon:yes stop_codon:yes gene_type:complete
MKEEVKTVLAEFVKKNPQPNLESDACRGVLASYLNDKLKLDYKVVTCAYCGKQHKDGTSASQNEELTKHIKICEKHPMRGLEEEFEFLKEQLVKSANTNGRTITKIIP